MSHGSPQAPITSRWRRLAGRSRGRLVILVPVGLVVGVLAAQVTPAVAGSSLSWAYPPLAGWDGAAAVFSAWQWASIGRFDAQQTAQHAARDDPGHAEADLILVCAAMASLVTVGLVLVQAAGTHGGQKDFLAAFGVLSEGVSWVAVHTLFTLRYARAYYRGAPGGIDFNQQARPRYLDFAYLAFTIGMTYQVSDTELNTSQIRALVLRHALVSYLFGAVILASSVNLISALAGSGG